MSPYLDFQVGNSYQVRGRALLYIQDKQRKQVITPQKLIEINGAALKEAMYNEFLNGRLIFMDVFEPFFVTTSPLERTMSSEELIKFARAESRDLIPLPTDHLEQETISEVVMEQAVARYITLYREKIYTRLAEQLSGEVFRSTRRTKFQAIYVALFRLAQLIVEMASACRNKDQIEIDYYDELIIEHQKSLPYLDLKKIAQVLKEGDGLQWQEIGTGIDSFFLTLKKHYPFPIDYDIYLAVKDSTLAWLREEIPSLYEDYFIALLNEEYEKAAELKNAIDSHYASQSLEGCC